MKLQRPTSACGKPTHSLSTRMPLLGTGRAWQASLRNGSRSLSLSPSPSLSLVGVSGFSLWSMARDSASGVGLSVGSKTAARRVVPRRLAALLLIPSNAHLGCPVLRGLTAPSFRLLGGLKSRSLEDSWESRARTRACVVCNRGDRIFEEQQHAAGQCCVRPSSTTHAGLS